MAGNTQDFLQNRDPGDECDHNENSYKCFCGSDMVIKDAGNIHLVCKNKNCYFSSVHVPETTVEYPNAGMEKAYKDFKERMQDYLECPDCFGKDVELVTAIGKFGKSKIFALFAVSKCCNMTVMVDYIVD